MENKLNTKSFQMMEKNKIENVEFVSKGFGNPKVIHNGYVYIRHTLSQKDGITVFWACSIRKCKARIHTINDCLIKIMGDHNHEADPMDLQKQITKANLMKMAVQTKDIPSKIVRDGLPKNEEVLKELPSPFQWARTVRRARKRHMKLSNKQEKVKVPELDPLYTTKNLMRNNCEKTFSSLTDLKKYIKRHTTEKSIQCNQCKRSFHNRREMKMHSISHSQMKTFQCVQCFIILKNESDLKKHILTHTEDKPFKCTICSESFSRLKELDLHLLKHSNQRIYKCDLCDEIFFSDQSLINHKRQFHSQEIVECKSGKHLEDHNYSITKHEVVTIKSEIELETSEFDVDMLEFIENNLFNEGTLEFMEWSGEVKIEPMSYEDCC